MSSVDDRTTATIFKLLDGTATKTGAVYWLLLPLLTAQTLASMDGSIVTVAAPAISSDLKASGSALQLIITSYLLAFGVLTVTGARLGDILGHRRAFLLGVAGFTLGSLACGLAVSAPMLIAARVGQASGAALMVPQIFALIQLRFTGASRRRAIGLWSMTAALGVALGQVVGGTVVSADLFGLSWRPVFLLNVPIGVLVAIACRALPGADVADRVRLDPVGVGLLTAAVTAVVVPLVYGPDQGWPIWSLVCLLGGAVGMAIFVRHQGALVAIGRHPLLDLNVLRPPGVTPGLIACCTVMGCYTSFVFVLTMYLQNGLAMSARQAGMAFLPYAIGFATLSLTWARTSERVQRTLPVIGPLAFAAGASAVALSGPGSWSGAATVPLLFLAGAGHAASYSPLISMVSTIVSTAEARWASALAALNSTGVLLAAVIGVAAFGSLYFQVAGDDHHHSYAGFVCVVAVLSALLLITAWCAYSTVRASPCPERPAPGLRGPRGPRGPRGHCGQGG